MKRKKERRALLLFLTVLLLTGCGEEKKADSYLKEGSYEEAIAIYEGLLSEKEGASERQKNRQLYSRMGEAYCYLEKYEEALDCFDRARELSDEEELEGELLLYRGLCLEKLAEYQEAAKEYEAYFEGLPEEEKEAEPEELSEEERSVRIFVYNEMGLCYMKQEEYEKALEAIVAGLALSPEEDSRQSLTKNKIIVLEYLARFEEAYAECEAYLQEYPEDAQMQKEYEFLKTRL